MIYAGWGLLHFVSVANRLWGGSELPAGKAVWTAWGGNINSVPTLFFSIPLPLLQ